MEYVTLNNGVQLPMIGFGTWDVRERQARKRFSPHWTADTG